ncbi:MAG TPA: bifunctional 5,10-methylenetetrahydrofolate dehydrogenase/5,10-methenyltetrahydrofolate cyclohydrolase [Dehalococcoidia bacterium]|nr:bifunctional 5,10-methylenetetrahydrofolate dehydrogenase/5,10-methenyltetrahydrofolate cyclohydrolase [Dehalococcoidia bacterium]
MAELIKGSLVASHLRHQVRKEVAAWRAAGGAQPCLAVCLVGDDAASQVYMRRKQQACAAVGITSVRVDLPAETAQAELERLICRWNADPAIHGILVQLPLPPQIDRFAVLDRIDPAKDVDGMGSANMGSLILGAPRFVPCTPAAIIELLKYHGVSTCGKHVVIVNRGIVVGLPLAALLLQDHPFGNATVTVCHEHTQDVGRICRRGDIVVVAVGKPDAFTLRGDMVKRGAVVIDVGISREGRRLTGDVAFEEVAAKAALITPVPGGVGPCTIAMLLKNTLQAARAALILSPVIFH